MSAELYVSTLGRVAIEGTRSARSATVRRITKGIDLLKFYIFKFKLIILNIYINISLMVIKLM